MIKLKAPKAIVGPLIADLIGIEGGDVTLATAFYTGGALNALNIKAGQLRLFMRLDTLSVADWASGSLDPVALRNFIRRHQQTCDDVSLYVNPTAHAKIYCGEGGYLIGSANLSTRALSGSAAEILWFENDDYRRNAIDGAIKEYARKFKKLSLDQLDDYIAKNKTKAKELAKKIPRKARFDEDRLPADISRPLRLGDYESFLNWLLKQKSPAAQEVLKRANGKSNLSGHIRQAFFGIRQFFLSNPEALSQFTKISPDGYSFSRDTVTAAALGNFIARHARVEGPFSPSKWQTYLPVSAGGNQDSGGATVGNLNRMFPLLARYLSLRIGVKP